MVYLTIPAISSHFFFFFSDPYFHCLNSQILYLSSLFTFYKLIMDYTVLCHIQIVTFTEEELVYSIATIINGARLIHNQIFQMICYRLIHAWVVPMDI